MAKVISIIIIVIVTPIVFIIIVIIITIVGIYRVSSPEITPKGHRSQPDLKSIHQYF